MRSSEAAWVSDALLRVGPEALNPLVELGSSTLEFRATHQPHIERSVHAPLRDRGIRIVTTDLKSGNGIDVSGNIYDRSVQDEIAAFGPRALLCCNILEHIPDPAGFARICDGILPPGGYLVVTVPHSYPYHLDPIDTMFRPGVREVCDLFPGYRLIDAKIISDTTYGHDLVQEHGWSGLPRFFAASAAKLIAFRGGLDRWKARYHRFLWMFRPYKTVGVLLQKAV